MELRQFAESILFARSLDGKLTDPGTITDLDPGPPMEAPDAPGRPAELRFKRKESGLTSAGPGFPGMRHLDRADNRGRILHYFANHELLAVELMALALLRFPDAPAAFRRGLLRTLREEQEHTRWYVDRMRACRVAFGELPVSGHLWRLLSRMESPLDYVSGLPLTFEQANLDFSRDYGRAFDEAGDTETAALLDRIHRDEIAHVGFGLKWFRRWKDPAIDDWDAYERQLHFPLSPSRAKGSILEIGSRRAAGLDDRFIEQLRVFGRSRGRAPTVHWFNPRAEESIADGAGLVRGASPGGLADDLGTLPMFLAANEDLVLVGRKPSPSFLATLQEAGFAIPEFEVARPHEPLPETLARRAIGGLRPWAWAPDSIGFLGPLARNLPKERQLASLEFRPERAALFGKAWSSRLLREWAIGRKATPWLGPPEIAGVEVADMPAVDAAIHAIRAGGHHRVVVKSDLGLAGKGMIRLWEPEVLPAQRRWMEGQLAAGRALVVEPWLDRIVDFSVQMDLLPSGLHIVGYTGLENDLRGQFRSNWAEARFNRRPPLDVIRAMAGACPQGDPGALMHSVFEEISTLLEPLLRSAGHVGPLGIDAFVYLRANGVPCLKPIVEINPRHTMGRVTLGLMRYVAPGRTARFRVVGRRDLRESGARSFVAYADGLQARSPWTRRGQPVARLESGSVCLTDPEQAVDCIATLEISPAGLQPRRNPSPSPA